MDDQAILELYFSRREEAIAQTDRKYRPYCYRIAYNILTSREDAEESVSDTYMAAWNAIPPHRPAVLATFLGKLTRNISIDRWRQRSAARRGGGEMPLALAELEECVAGRENVEQAYERKETVRAYLRFLEALPDTQRRVFLCRYWYGEPVDAIAEKFGFSRSKVKTMLHRTRKKLRDALAGEGLL